MRAMINWRRGHAMVVLYAWRHCRGLFRLQSIHRIDYSAGADRLQNVGRMHRASSLTFSKRMAHPSPKRGFARSASCTISNARSGDRQSADERLTARKQQSQTILDDFHIWLKEQQARVSRKSQFGQALDCVYFLFNQKRSLDTLLVARSNPSRWMGTIDDDTFCERALAYIAQHWRGLTVFAENGQVDIDNNPIENRIRPQALTRKNALFAGHDEDGQSWARIASLIETCRLNDVDPYA